MCIQFKTTKSVCLGNSSMLTPIKQTMTSNEQEGLSSDDLSSFVPDGMTGGMTKAEGQRARSNFMQRSAMGWLRTQGFAVGRHG
eukprot:m.95211 g.95211  ORF g.95211 m.95211 type:complete len:84 (+) comp15010_c0_seq25:1316-1567(+)